jgi:hypothetical protein
MRAHLLRVATLATLTAASLAHADEPPAPAPVAPAPAPAAAVTTAAPAPAPAASATPEDDTTAPTVVEDDVAPSLKVFSSGGTTLAVGGLIQLQAAPYVGADSLLSEHDPASRAGFRLRRARLAVDATLGNDLRFVLAINPLTSDKDTGTISQATLSYQATSWLRVSAGADRVPFTRGNLIASSRLPTIERPLAVQLFVPDNRLGVFADGTLADGAFTYLAAVMNATVGFDLGNQFGGLLYVGRVQTELHSGDLTFGGGVGAMFEDGAATRTLGGSVDVHASVSGFQLVLEGMGQKLTPVDSPTTSPTVAAEITRVGAYAELSYQRPHFAYQPVVRLEYVDDNTDVDDAGDALLLSAGVNARVLDPHLRLQLFYLGRYERKSAERANDAVILAVQGEF